jgi:hypothetical protein
MSWLDKRARPLCEPGCGSLPVPRFQLRLAPKAQVGAASVEVVARGQSVVSRPDANATDSLRGVHG